MQVFYEIKESGPSDTRCCYQCGNKRMVQCCRRRSLTTFSWCHGFGMQEKVTNVSKRFFVFNVHSFEINVSRIQSYSHFQGHHFNISRNCMLQYIIFSPTFLLKNGNRMILFSWKQLNGEHDIFE